MMRPALSAFAEQIKPEFVLAQAWIRRLDHGFELRHVEDRSAEPDALRRLGLEQLRPLAQHTGAGSFRPLRSAPDLQRGWRILLADPSELELAIRHLYPGALADWHAAQSPNPPITHFRQMAARQTGIYRVTQMLDNQQVALVIRATCPPQFCLKRRLWTVEGLPPDPPSEKSLIPCLEPCAILLEFARKAKRLEQQQKSQLQLSPEEAESIRSALAKSLAQPAAAVRAADFSAPDNPRRLQYLLEKLAVIPKPVQLPKED